MESEDDMIIIWLLVRLGVTQDNIYLYLYETCKSQYKRKM